MSTQESKSVSITLADELDNLSDTEILIKMFKELREVKAKVELLSVENKVGLSNITMKMEGVFSSSAVKPSKRVVGAAKKKTPVGSKSASGKKCKYINTMYWFIAMYVEDNDNISAFYTEDLVKQATDSLQIQGSVSDMKRKKITGSKLWKLLDPSIKKTKIRALFDKFKVDLDKAASVDVEPEMPTDNEQP